LTSIYFVIKDNVDADKRLLLDILFNDWIDDHCNNQVKVIRKQSLYRVEFYHCEDAVTIHLKGLPSEFQKYLEILR
jgi:hypothetical protein